MSVNKFADIIFIAQQIACVLHVWEVERLHLNAEMALKICHGFHSKCFDSVPY
jgi:hypothetical protein